MPRPLNLRSGCDRLARVVGHSGPSSHAAPSHAFVHAAVSKNSVEDDRIQSEVDVPEGPAPGKQEISKTRHHRHFRGVRTSGGGAVIYTNGTGAKAGRLEELVEFD